MVLVALSQVFATIMNSATRVLELDGERMHPLQILFARMIITAVASSVYMYYTQVPHFPLGAKGVRGLLVLRGVTGFVGNNPNSLPDRR